MSIEFFLTKKVLVYPSNVKLDIFRLRNISVLLSSSHLLASLKHVILFDIYIALLTLYQMHGAYIHCDAFSHSM